MRLIVAVLVSLASSTLHAQTRTDSSRVRSAVGSAVYVVTGTVVKAQIRPVTIDSVPTEARVLTVAITERWKGDAPDTLPVLLLRGGHPQYGVPDTVGARLLLYLNRLELSPELLVVGVQSGTLQDTAEDQRLIPR